MKVNTDTFAEIRRPMYVLEEKRLRRNLTLISSVAKQADVDIILAFKAFALWKTFPIFREYISSTTASSLSEALLAYKKFGHKAHTYSPAYTDDEIDDIARCSSHLTFNSLSQYQRLHERVKAVDKKISLGLRVNPEYSEVGTDLYNPCAPGTRFGVTAHSLPLRLPDNIEGFHCHCHCESGADVFERTLAHIEQRFSPWFSQLKWINFGGGHLMTRHDYDVTRLVRILKGFHRRYPHLKVIMEPGSAFAWQTGVLVAQVVDVVENAGIKTAVLNVSFTCHMPDCLEMPYMPQVRGAEVVDDAVAASANDIVAASANDIVAASANDTTRSVNDNNNATPYYIYRLGGCSCLSGDFMGSWRFDHALQVGENIVFEDMIHYTTVKTNMFNGISHPDIAMVRQDDNQLEILRTFTPSDYLSRMD